MFGEQLPGLVAEPLKYVGNKEVCLSKHTKTVAHEPDDKDEEVYLSKHAKGREPVCSRANSSTGARVAVPESF